MQEMTSITHSIYEIVHLKVFLKNFAQKFQPIGFLLVLDKPTIDPVHLDLFRPSVIRGPWTMV